MTTRALVTNDDGIASEGIRALAGAAIGCGLDVVVAAPADEASGSSAALTAARESGRIPVEERSLDGLEGVSAYAVSAAPAFIALIATRGAFGPPPDVVLSGINRGANTGYAILHSGTVGAALTDRTQGLPGLAVSLDGSAPTHWVQSTANGKGVTFTQSYDASGAQSRAVLAGLPADEVHLSLGPDVTKLVKAGIVASDWNAGPNKGIITQSVVVIVVRKGNPKHITGWNDLIKPGIKIVTPNPGSSGSAKWNILAAYGSQIAAGKSKADATAYLKKFIGNVATWPDSGSKATAAFVGGTGDVLISYENEAIAARRAGDAVDYIVPSSTLLIQNPGAVTKNAPQAAKDFLAFQLSAEGQKDYATFGFRPLTPEPGITVKGAENPSDPFPAPAKLLTIKKDFGGWTAANALFFGDNGIVTKLIAAAGTA